MKYIITEDQLNKVKEKILKLQFSVFNNDWDLLQEFLKRRGNPPYIIDSDVDLRERQDIESLGSLIEVKGNLILRYTSIKSLGNLTSVGGYLNLDDTPIQSLGNLTSVGRDLMLQQTPISKKYTEKQIRDMVQVGRNIYL